MLNNQSPKAILESKESKTRAVNQKEISLAISHYHHKLGIKFIGISYNFTHFGSLTQYNILQDSISSGSTELALFLENKESAKYVVHIKKV